MTNAKEEAETVSLVGKNIAGKKLKSTPTNRIIIVQCSLHYHSFALASHS